MKKRSNGKKEKSSKSNSAPTTNAASKQAADSTTAAAAEEETTLWQTLTSHPLVQVAPIILIPYFIYTTYYFLVLKRPDLLGGFVNLRPAVGVHDARQLLIVGSMSSGTVQVSSDLSSHLKLEIGHEVSNAETHFTRDGTVSWFHIVRYLRPPQDDKEKMLALVKLCSNYTANMGFHPRMYKSSSSCSLRKKWDKCWARECLSVVNQEWGCALQQEENSCETPFQSTLHQVRHPLRTVESLITKFCQGSDLNGTLHDSFVRFMEVLFPEQEWKQMSCVEGAARYVVDFNKAMLEANEAGLVDAMYKIEESSPCDVARMAGLLDAKTTVYAPNHERISKLCDILGDMNPAHEVMVSKKHKINEGQVSLGWEDLRGGMHGSKRPDGDTSIEDQVKELVVILGYDPNETRVSSDGAAEDTEF